MTNIDNVNLFKVSTLIDVNTGVDSHTEPSSRIFDRHFTFVLYTKI